MRRVPLPRQARGEVSKVEMMERDRNVKGSTEDAEKDENKEKR